MGKYFDPYEDYAASVIVIPVSTKVKEAYKRRQRGKKEPVYRNGATSMAITKKKLQHRVAGRHVGKAV